MFEHYNMLKSIYDLAKEELNENGSIGYTLPNGKYHLYIYVDEINTDDEPLYIVEANEVIDGAHEPIGKCVSSAPYNDFEALMLACMYEIELCESYEVKDFSDYENFNALAEAEKRELSYPQRYPELSSCADFETLRLYCTEDELDYYEKELQRYLAMSDEECGECGENIPRIACWYEGTETTEQFLEI